jgi:hypothetical protein
MTQGFFQRRVRCTPGFGSDLDGDTSLYRVNSSRYNALSGKAFLASQAYNGVSKTLPGFQATTSGVEKLTDPS